MINYVSIQLIYINFIKLYLTNFRNNKMALNNLVNYIAILLTGTMGGIDESMTGAKMRWFRSLGHASCEWSINSQSHLIRSCPEFSGDDGSIAFEKYTNDSHAHDRVPYQSSPNFDPNAKISEGAVAKW